MRADSGAEVVLSFAARTDVGKRREHNEDSWGARFPVYLVADGMGGHRAGDVASRAVVDGMLHMIPEGRFVGRRELSAALSHVAAEVSDLGVGDAAPGSTLTGLVFQEHRGLPCTTVFNIGDSRTYLLSGGQFSQVTVDHSEVQELLDAGTVTEVEARALPRQNIITRALGAGSGPYVPADLFMIPARSGDRWVLCSDGLSGEVTDALIEMITRALPNPCDVADELVTQALNAGGKDNVTVVVIDIDKAAPEWEQGLTSDETAGNEEHSNEDTLPVETNRRFVWGSDGEGGQ